VKKVLLYIPIGLSLAILGAHFMRYGNSLGMLGTAVLMVLLFVRQWWAARLVQAALVLGAGEWVYTLYSMNQVRMAFAEPTARLNVILGTVIAVTLLSAVLFQTRELKKIYSL
jgi:thiol:disulfide interchange protein